MYPYEIKDEVTIRFIILFTLSKAGRPLSVTQIDELILKNCIINYFDLQLSLQYLVDIKHVDELNTQEGIRYQTTQKGNDAAKWFYKEVPIYLREPIENSILPMQKQEEEKQRVQGNIIPINQNEYCVECILKENNMEILNLQFYAGTKQQAKDMAKQFSQDPQKLYNNILKALTENNS